MTLERRFHEMWSALAAIGASSSSSSGVAAGYNRFAWTAVDLELRRWFRDEARAFGLEVEQDRNGNLWAWWDVEDRHAHPGGDGAGGADGGAVVTGSHLDSVPGGGAFDGPLGVVSAFLAIGELKRRSVTPLRPIAVVDFADEEGARFGVACVGSRLLTGALDPERARCLRDAEGVTLETAMREAGTDPAGLGLDEARLGSIAAFIELHIEQGRNLGPLGAPVGVATGIWPHGRWRCSCVGQPNHAGTTLLADRHDPVLVLATVALSARRLALELGCHATIGKVRVEPNATNGIAYSATAWLDARAAEEATVARLVEELTAIADRAGAEHGVATTITAESFSPAVTFDLDLRDRVIGALGRAPELATAAGHDAGVLASRVPAAMIFVRNPTGASHTPAEWAEPEDCLAGVRGLEAVLEELACRPSEPGPPLASSADLASRRAL